LQDALWICENNGLLVKSVGRGKVMSQSIVEGQKINRGQQIQIQLN
jgi:beta-lactam-binding protein with PASTA domain